MQIKLLLLLLSLFAPELHFNLEPIKVNSKNQIAAQQTEGHKPVKSHQMFSKLQ